MKSEQENKIPRHEYPRPQFVRKNNWINLNGEWNFAFDDNNEGLKEEWYKESNSKIIDKKIIVPFCFQSELSGISDYSPHRYVWYKKQFNIPDSFKDKHIIIHFGAVDYACRVYLNNSYIGSHEGGYIGFSFDITSFIQKKNTLIIFVEDPYDDLEIPRGKQFWKKKWKSIFYPNITGIWQTVWIEAVNAEFYLKKLMIYPDLDSSEILIKCQIPGFGTENLTLNAIVHLNSELVSEVNIPLIFLGYPKKKLKVKELNKERIQNAGIELDFYDNPNRFKFILKIPKNKLVLWSPSTPNLYDLRLKIVDKVNKKIYDEVESYFGMRKIAIDSNGRILLNNEPIYQKLILVQGYWPDGLYTAPSDEAFKLDIRYIKQFGFNGLRAHQKAFDPRFLYWCDKEGLLVWSELGSSFDFSNISQKRFIDQYMEMMERDFNHPSIIVWTILNEGWGVFLADKYPDKVDFILSLFYLVGSIDSSRLIIDNDGWWHTQTHICTKHFYADCKYLPKTFKEEIEREYVAPNFPSTYLRNFKYENEPIIYSEIGGVAFDYYHIMKRYRGVGLVNSSKEFLEYLDDLIHNFIERRDWIQGFCYTQLYDQFQEINGLLTFDRTPKIAPEELRNRLQELKYE